MTEQEGRIAPPPVLSQSRLSRSLAVLAQIIAQALGLLLAAGDDRHSVVAGDAAEHIGQLHRVDGRTRRVGEPRQRLEQHNDPRIVHATLHSFKMSFRRFVLSMWPALPDTA